MEWYLFLAVIGVGFIAGIINTLAAGGSLLALPMLIIPLGIPSVNANAINRIAILLQNIIAVKRFQKKEVLNLKQDYRLGIPAVIGSLLGSYLASNITAPEMDRAIGIIMIVMFLIILLNPSRWLGNKKDVSPLPLWLQYIIFFGIGVYGGFLQAGVGFFLITGLVLAAGYDLMKTTGIKVLIILMYTPFALGIFIWHDLLTWKYALYGLLLAIGNMTGAYVAVNLAVKWGTKFIRYMLLAAVLVAGIMLLI